MCCAERLLFTKNTHTSNNEGSDNMKILLLLFTIIIPVIMLYLDRRIDKAYNFFNLFAVISFLIFSIIASTSIYQIIADGDVFMTTIHGLFLNEVFLLTAAYVGLFTIYRLMKITLEES